MKKCPFCAEEIQDAAVVCKHCGRDLPAPIPAAAAPAPAPARKSRPLLVYGGLAVLVILVLIAAQPGGPVGGPKLKASVAQRGQNLLITNSDHQDWLNVRATINDDFECEPVAAPQGKDTAIPLASCVSKTGARFSVLTMAPRSVVVRAILVDDTGEASNIFTFR